MKTAGTDPTAADISVTLRDPRLVGPPTSPGALFELLRRRVRAGELGPWPVVFGLVVIGIVFTSLDGAFLSAENLSKLTLQIAAGGTVAVGIVLVLLLGEIDLSAGSVSGAAGSLLAVLAIRHGLPDIVAILGALALGALIGAAHGFVFARLGVPSFVVTLAGLLGWLGLQLWILKPQGTINLRDKGLIASLTHMYLTRPVGWILVGVLVATYVGIMVWDRTRRLANGLPATSLTALGIRAGGLAIGGAVTVAVLNGYRGVPLALLIFLGIVVGFDLILRKTRYGRAIYAVGGNVEAARRAGINVSAIRISVLALCSTLAAAGGILAASRGYQVGQSSGGGDFLLMAIAAAVIGGTSLFGGRGTTYSALLGWLVLGAIQSGMLLLALNNDFRYMITASVLVAAVILDSLSRRGRRSSGRE